MCSSDLLKKSYVGQIIWNGTVHWYYHTNSNLCDTQRESTLMHINKILKKVSIGPQTKLLKWTPPQLNNLCPNVLIYIYWIRDRGRQESTHTHTDEMRHTTRRTTHHPNVRHIDAKCKFIVPKGFGGCVESHYSSVSNIIRSTSLCKNSLSRLQPQQVFKLKSKKY